MKSQKLRIKDGILTLLTLGIIFGGNVLVRPLFDTRPLIPMIFVLGVFLISPECLASAVVMLIVAVMTGTLTTRIKVQEKIKAESDRERMREDAQWLI